jgi:tRNA threonylcarbamoyl adenosine modification protein (Sua5/YciO/YrdC/YwlC family)
MTLFITVHPDNPQARLIKQIANVVRDGGIVIYPTDSSYALGCHIGDKRALDRIRAIRKLDEKHNMTLVCRDLAEISHYAKVENSAFRLIKNLTPGPYTFLLKATQQVPKRLQHPKRKTVGLRVPDNTIALALLAELGEPIMSTTLKLPGDDLPLTDPYEIRDLLDHQVELIIDGGYCGIEPTTVVDFLEDPPVVVREGVGVLDALA